MVATLNDCQVDYVCFGNHETDVPHFWLVLVAVALALVVLLDDYYSHPSLLQLLVVLIVVIVVDY